MNSACLQNLNPNIRRLNGRLMSAASDKEDRNCYGCNGSGNCRSCGGDGWL